MDKVNVMVVTTAKGPSKQKAAGVFIIEHLKDGIPHTKEGFLFDEHITGVDLTIRLLCNAIYILTKAKIELESIYIVTEEPIVTSAFTQKWIDKWIANDWKKPNGAAVQNSDDWKKLVELLEGLSKRYIFGNTSTSYFHIMHLWAEKYYKLKTLGEFFEEKERLRNETGNR